jgi:hypothetical protein
MARNLKYRWLRWYNQNEGMEGKTPLNIFRVQHKRQEEGEGGGGGEEHEEEEEKRGSLACKWKTHIKI